MYGGRHWTVRSQISHEWKWRVKAALLKYRINKMPFKAAINIHFDVYVGRPIDPDNVVLKTYIDGLREWGCLVNDDPRYVKQISVSVYTKEKNERVEITIQ